MCEVFIKNLTVTYKNKSKKAAYKPVIAINGLSLTLHKNKINVIMGASGSGKTTLLNAIAGLIDYDGEIFFDNKNANEMDIKQRNVSLVSQQFVLYPHLTVFDNIAFPLKLTKATREEIIERVIKISRQLEIYECLTRKPRHLSIGQQQRVAIARALIKRPNICLLDEPLSNIDEKQRVYVRMLIKKTLSENNVTAVYVTHDFKDALSIADYVTVIDEGKPLITGTPSEVFESQNQTAKLLLGKND